jgi:hypothetical protein
MSSVITTVETDVKAVVNTVSTDLQSEVTRLTGLLAKAKTTITAQAQSLANHVNAAVTSNTVVSQAAATLKAASDDFEKVLSAVAAPVAAAVATAIPLVVNTVPHNAANVTVAVAASIAQTVVQAAASPTAVAQTAPTAQTTPGTANAVVVALDAALHASNVAPTLHNLVALEEAYARLMANAGTSNSAAVPLPPQVAAIVQAASTTSTGVLSRVEGGAEAAVTEVEKIASEVKAEAEKIAEGNVTIGPLHI